MLYIPTQKKNHYAAKYKSFEKCIERSASAGLNFYYIFSNFLQKYLTIDFISFHKIHIYQCAIWSLSLNQKISYNYKYLMYFS